MAHSSVGASHGLLLAGLRDARLRATFAMNTIPPRRMTAAPMVANRLAGPQPIGRIGVDTPDHAFEAENVHRKESKVEADNNQPKSPFAQALTHHAASHFRKPIVDGAKQRKYRATDQHVVKVSDDKIGIMHLGVEWYRGDHHTSQTPYHESCDKTDHEKKRRFRCLAPSTIGFRK